MVPKHEISCQSNVESEGRIKEDQKLRKRNMLTPINSYFLTFKIMNALAFDF